MVCFWGGFCFFGGGLASSGVEAGQDLQFFNPGGHTLRTVSLNVKFSVRSAPPAVATHIRAAGRNLELLLELSESGTRKAFSRFLSYACHKLHSPFIFLSTDRFK